MEWTSPRREIHGERERGKREKRKGGERRRGKGRQKFRSSHPVNDACYKEGLYDSAY